MLKSLLSIRGRWPELGLVAIASLVVSGLVITVRNLGGLQDLELSAYDRFVQFRPVALGRVSKLVPGLQPPPSPDPRILVIGITEKDTQDLGGKSQLSDQVYAQLISTLLRYQPRAIGLDIYRDKPVEPGHKAFVSLLKNSDRIIGITRLGDDRNPTIAPPPGLKPEQIGFNDVLVDPGGTIRRSLLFLPSDTPGESLFSFSLRLALRYLQDQGIEAKNNAQNPEYLQLNQAVFLPLKANDGSYINADVRGYQILLNYRVDNQRIQQRRWWEHWEWVSLGEILAVDPASPATSPVEPKSAAPKSVLALNPKWQKLIQNRIVLIGNVAESGKDFFYTPFSSQSQDEQRMPGVVIHAQMVSQFLDAATGERPLFWFWSETEEILWIFGWALTGGLAVWLIRNPLLLTLSGLLGLGMLFVLCDWAFLHSGWIPFVPPLLATVTTAASVLTYTAQQAYRQQQMVMRLLGQSTSPEIAETLWQQRDQLLENGKLAGQNLMATLLFTDLRNFTTISEQYDDPKPLLEWLNEYLEEMTQVVQTHHGVINKFTGDGVMAVFGVPLLRNSPKEIAEDAERAVACALAMGDRLQNLNQAWQQRGLQPVEMRAGIFTGPIVAGSLGGKNRLEYGVIGDSVNTASRLESLDKHRQPTACRVLIAEQTLMHLQDKFEVESWGKLELKGKDNRIEIYRVVGLKTPPE
jgi:adenylate cyclase